MKWQKGSKPTLTLRIKAFEVFQRALPLPDGLPNLNGGLPPPADCFPWQPIQKESILPLRRLRLFLSKSACCVHKQESPGCSLGFYYVHSNLGGQ